MGLWTENNWKHIPHEEVNFQKPVVPRRTQRATAEARRSAASHVDDQPSRASRSCASSSGSKATKKQRRKKKVSSRQKQQSTNAVSPETLLANGTRQLIEHEDEPTASQVTPPEDSQVREASMPADSSSPSQSPMLAEVRNISSLLRKIDKKTLDFHDIVNHLQDITMPIDEQTLRVLLADIWLDVRETRKEVREIRRKLYSVNSQKATRVQYEG